MTNIEKAKEFFIKDRYAMITTGIEIEEVEEKYAKCSLKINENHTNATGHVMGGAIFTLADFTFAVSINLLRLPQQVISALWVVPKGIYFTAKPGF